MTLTLLYKCKLVTCHIQGPTLPRIEFHAYLVKDLRRNGRKLSNKIWVYFIRFWYNFFCCCYWLVTISWSAPSISQEVHGLVEVDWRETTLSLLLNIAFASVSHPIMTIFWFTFFKKSHVSKRPRTA